MKKIVLVGSPGAGKSTLAKKLGKILDIEVIHLDKYFWQKDWQEQPKDVWIDFQQHLVRIQQWIIDGTYLSTSDIRLEAADTLIFLDMPRVLCLWRVIRRHFQYTNKPRPDFSEEVLDKLDSGFIMKVIWTFPHSDRKILLGKFRSFTKKNASFRKLIYYATTDYSYIMGQSLFLSMWYVPINNDLSLATSKVDSPKKNVIRLRSKRAVEKFVQDLCDKVAKEKQQKLEEIKQQAESALTIMDK